MTPWRDFDTLAGVIPSLRDRVADYHAYGRASIQTVLGEAAQRQRHASGGEERRVHRGGELGELDGVGRTSPGGLAQQRQRDELREQVAELDDLERRQVACRSPRAIPDCFSRKLANISVLA